MLKVVMLNVIRMCVAMFSVIMMGTVLLSISIVCHLDKFHYAKYR
jgi:hypothetical protein